MLTLKEIRERLVDRRLDIVARVTGIHYNTLKKIRDTPGCNPTYRVLAAINKYMEKDNGQYN